MVGSFARNSKFGVALSTWLIGCTGLVSACASGQIAQVSSGEIPTLASEVARKPEDGKLRLRYAAALLDAGQCDSATVEARHGMVREPKDALGPLIVGRCLEEAGAYERAISVYDSYADDYPDEPGSAAVATRALLARQENASVRVRMALRDEAELASADPSIVAVMPVEIIGDSSYQSLSRGLAQILTSDLAMLERFRMVERLQISALLTELQLAQTGRVDQSTTARMGRLLQAGRMVQGLAYIHTANDTRLQASILLSNGEVRTPAPTAGRFRDLMQMEKQIVIRIARQLGYVLSRAERQTILENGTQSIIAFLAFSQGLEAEAFGDYATAAVHYAEAVKEDPDFQQARDGYESTAASLSMDVSATGDLATLAASPPAEDPEVLFGGGVAADAITTVVGDLSPTISEATAPIQPAQTVGQAGTTSTANTPTTVANKNPPPTATGTIRIIFRLP